MLPLSLDPACSWRLWISTAFLVVGCLSGSLFLPDMSSLLPTSSSDDAAFSWSGLRLSSVNLSLSLYLHIPTLSHPDSLTSLLSSHLYSLHITTLHLSTVLTYLLSPHLCPLYISTLFTSLLSAPPFTSLLSSHLYSLHISTLHFSTLSTSLFSTSLLSWHIYSLHIPSSHPYSPLLSSHLTLFTPRLSHTPHLYSLHISTLYSPPLCCLDISAVLTSLLSTSLPSIALLSWHIYTLHIWKIPKTQLRLLNFLWKGGSGWHDKLC